MKKLKPKQILIIVLALIIGAAIIAFPFIFNAVKANNNDAATRIKTIGTVNLPKTGSKTLTDQPTEVNPNLFYNGGFAINTTGQTTWVNPNGAIIDGFNMYSNRITTTVTLNKENYALEIDVGSDLDTSVVYSINLYATGMIGKTLEAGTYTISLTGSSAKYISQFKLYDPDNQTITGFTRTGNIAYKTFTLNETFTITTNSLIQLRWFDPGEKIVLYGIKLEKGSVCTAPLGLQNYDEIYDLGENDGHKQGYDEGYDEGYDKGKDETFDLMKNMQIAGPNMAWEANGGMTGSYNSTTDTLTAGISENSVQYIKLDTNITLETGMGISVKWESISPTSNINLSFDYQYATGTVSYGSITTANINDGLISFVVPEAANGQTKIYFKNYSGANVNIQGLKIYQLNSGTTAYENGYQAGLNQGNANAGKQYDNGYQAGLAAGRAEGTATENFAMLFPAIFGSVLSFFVNTGESMTIFGVSLWSIAVTFIAILVITKVVKLLL